MVPTDFRYIAPFTATQRASTRGASRPRGAAFTASRRLPRLRYASIIAWLLSARRRHAAHRLAPFTAPLRTAPLRWASQRSATYLAATMFALGGLLPAEMATPQVTDASTGCGYWRSETKPPPAIKVLFRDGHMRWVDFRKYVQTVVSSEWGSTPAELRKAGAVAVKQYGWRHVSRWHGQSYRGSCFHVYGWNRDQIYKEGKTASVVAVDATSATWSWTLRNWRTGSLLFTSYRAGEAKRCASDAGKRLYARSATRCAWAGWSAERILETYYADHHAALRR